MPNQYLQEVFSWKFDYELRARGIYITVYFNKDSGIISIHDNSQNPEDATKNSVLLKDKLESCLTQGKRVSQTRYDEDKYCRKVSFNINDVDRNKIKELPLLGYYVVTQNIDYSVTNKIVDNLIYVIVNLDSYIKNEVGNIKVCEYYVKIPILEQDGYPPLAMFLDLRDGEISMGVGCQGGTSNAIMEDVIRNIEDRVKKHKKLRKYFYNNPTAEDKDLQEKERSHDGHFSRLYLTKGLLDRIKAGNTSEEKKQEEEDRKNANIIIQNQLKIYKALFNGNITEENKKNFLKQHDSITANGNTWHGMDWWVFPGFITISTDYDKPKATERIYAILSKNKEYCDRYKTFIYHYIAAFDDKKIIDDEETIYEIRFNKLVESLIGMTANNTRTLAGFNQKEQDLLFIAVQNFKDRIDYKCQDTHYHKYFSDLHLIADESKEIRHHIWLDEARVKLRNRLGLAVGETDSSKIQAKAGNYKPTFGSGDNLNPAQIDDFNKRSQPYCESNNPTGCGTFVGEISSKDVRYPFVHFRLTHDPISEKDKSKKDKLTRISDKEYLKYPPVAAICIDYPDYRSSDQLPSQSELKAEYKQRTLETLILYNKLQVDHLVKHGDGMGVFLKQKQSAAGHYLVIPKFIFTYTIIGFKI